MDGDITDEEFRAEGEEEKQDLYNYRQEREKKGDGVIAAGIDVSSGVKRAGAVSVMYLMKVCYF